MRVQQFRQRTVGATVRGIDLIEFLGDGANREVDLLGRMVAGDEEPEPGGPFLDGRVQDRLDVDPAAAQLLRELQRVG